MRLHKHIWFDFFLPATTELRQAWANSIKNEKFGSRLPVRKLPFCILRQQVCSRRLHCKTADPFYWISDEDKKKKADKRKCFDRQWSKEISKGYLLKCLYKNIEINNSLCDVQRGNLISIYLYSMSSTIFILKKYWYLRKSVTAVQDIQNDFKLARNVTIRLYRKQKPWFREWWRAIERTEGGEVKRSIQFVGLSPSTVFNRNTRNFTECFHTFWNLQMTL